MEILFNKHSPGDGSWWFWRKGGLSEFSFLSGCSYFTDSAGPVAGVLPCLAQRVVLWWGQVVGLGPITGDRLA